VAGGGSSVCVAPADLCVPFALRAPRWGAQCGSRSPTTCHQSSGFAGAPSSDYQVFTAHVAVECNFIQTNTIQPQYHSQAARLS